MRSRASYPLLLAVLCAGSCAGPASKVDLPPATLTIAVAAIPEVRIADADNGLRFSADATAVRDMLVANLRANDAGSRVFVEGDRSAKQADVVLRLTFSAPIAMAHEGTSSYLAAGGLWLVTWIGGLCIEDSSYNVSVAGTCALRTPRDRSIEIAVGGKPVAVSFLERNDFFSWPTLQSLVLPPFWTTDQSDTTSAALSRRAIENLAADIATFLKQDFEVRALESDFCQLRLLGPNQNGAPVTGTTMPIEFEIVATSEIKKVALAVNDGAPQAIAPAQAEQPALDRHRALVRTSLTGLSEDRANFVRVTIETKEEFTRTLRFGPRHSR